MSRAATDAELARVVREHAGRLAASLVRLIGDFAAAEDLVQDAVQAALEHWPHEGIPANPDGWLYTVARRRGLDVLRRDARHRDKLALMQWPIPSAPDDRLRLIFTCCHPALPRAAQVALTLRVVCGLYQRPDCQGVPGARNHGGPTHYPGQAEDRQRGHPVPHPGR